MTIKYLKGANTLQELKEVYFKMSKINHPDVGGSLEIMKIINNEYDYLKKILPNRTATNKDDKVINENSYSMNNFKDLINELLRYKNLTITIVGSWVWVKGQGTFTIKDDVLYSKLNFKYSKGQKSFYWYDGIENSIGKFKGGFLNNALNKYEVITFNSKGSPELA